MKYRRFSDKHFALTDLEDGQLGIDLNHLEKLENDIIRYLDLLGLDCNIAIEIHERDDKKIPLA